MKKVTQGFKKAVVNFWEDEDAQGMIEYILILVAVVAIVGVAGKAIKNSVSSKANSLGSEIGNFSVGDE